jgi:TolB protein
MLSLQARRLTLAAAALVVVTTALSGDTSAEDKGPVVIDVTQPQRSLYPLAIPVGVNSDSALAKEVAEVASFDMSVAGWFKVLDPKSFLADLDAEQLAIVPKKWEDVGAFGVIKTRVVKSGDKVSLTFKLYEVEKGKEPVLERTYSGKATEVRKLTHKWCNEVVKYYTGEDGFFGSKIAFVVKGSRNRKIIKAMDFDGNGVYDMTRNRSINILPSWSPGGGKLAFTSYMRANPDLYVVGSGGGRPKRLTKYAGMNTGASWSPDGSKIALTLSKDGNPEIYLVSAKTGKILERLTNNRHIDTSPSFSPDGSEIVFVSNREGGPQIFVMSSSGGNPRRVSKNGDYNTEPTWSPRKDKRIIAYTTRDGNYDIVTLDLDSKEMVRITQGQGNNEEPSFAPNGRAIAFASRRKSGNGVYIANADGTGKQRLVYKGAVTSVAWGPVP